MNDRIVKACAWSLLIIFCWFFIPIVPISLLLLHLLKKYWPRYPSSWQIISKPGTSCHSSDQHRTVNLIYKQKWNQASRAVKRFLSSRLVMNSRRLWNSHQRHKFFRAEVSRNILKFRVSEMAFPGVFKRYFHCGHHVVSSEYTKKWEQCRWIVSGVFHDTALFERFTDLNLFKYAFNVIQNWETDAFQFYSMVLIFCLQLW